MKTPSSYPIPPTESSQQKLDRLNRERAEIEQEEQRIDREITRKHERREEEIDAAEKECAWERRERLKEEIDNEKEEIEHKLYALGVEAEVELDRLAAEASVQGIEQNPQALRIWLRSNRERLLWLLTPLDEV